MYQPFLHPFHLNIHSQQVGLPYHNQFHTSLTPFFKGVKVVTHSQVPMFAVVLTHTVHELLVAFVTLRSKP